MGNNIVRPIAIAKFSEEKYISEIIKKEELFFNPIEYFVKKENENYRFDQYEGCDRIYQPSYIVDFKINNRSYKLADSENPIKIRLNTTDYFTHICCFTYFTNKIITRKHERKVFDPRLYNFGNYFLIGMDIKQILEVIENACKCDPNILK